MKGVTSFTKEEDDFIKENYLDIPVKKMAAILKRSFCGIEGRLKAMNLSIPKELAQKRKESGMYRKGQIPPNKGKKQVDYLTPEQLERVKATWFKKGNVAANRLPDWTEVLSKDKSGRNYILIRLPGSGKLTFKHIWLWETHQQKKLEKGMNIVFRDGNTENCTIENLECISNAELMNRNTLHRYPKEIAEIIQIKAAITRQINKNSNNDRQSKKSVK